MSLETDELHSTFAQEEEKENNDPCQHRTTLRPCQIKLPLNPNLFSLGTLPDDEIAIASISASTCVGTQKKTSLHVRKFFYPRFKRRACGILHSESLQFCARKGEKTENCLQPVYISETLPNVTLTKEFPQKTDSRDKVHCSCYEVCLRDIANCESPANFLQHGNEKDFSPRANTATPNPTNRNPAFRFFESPCSEKFPLLSFASLEEKQDKYVASPSQFIPTPYSGKGVNGTKSNESKSVLCSNIGNVLMNSSNLTEPQPPGGIACVEEHEKENCSPALKSTSKAVLVYRSLKKTKKKRQLRQQQLLSIRQATDAGIGISTTRNRARLDRVMYHKCVRSGPILRSSQNVQMPRDKIVKERPLSTSRSKKFLVKALLEKYLWNRRLKSGTPSRREVCLPFLSGEAGRRVECFYCKAFVAPHDLTSCSHKDCDRRYHLTCGRSLEDFHFRKNGDIICPQHVCMVCKGYNKSKVFRCERCTVAAHKKCFAFPENAIFLDLKPDCFICWRHPQDWRLESEGCCSTRHGQQIQRKLSNDYLCHMVKLNSVLGVSLLRRLLEMDWSLPHLFIFGGIYSLLRRNVTTLMMELVALVKILVVRIVNAGLMFEHYE